jgi:2-polyprenyl-3-methyl-5-hydroxy-6-metoxy-1,4-benzoquinol methylase
MDVGCGDGYLLRQIGRKAKSANLAVELVGADMSRVALDLAQEKSIAEGLELQTHQVNLLTQELPPADIVINSLFLHHFTEDQIIVVLEKFKTATKRLLIVEDLRRTALGYGLCYVSCRLLTSSPIVHYDGMRSVEGALKISELEKLMKRARLDAASVTRRWPQRFVIQWIPSECLSSNGMPSQ